MFLKRKQIWIALIALLTSSISGQSTTSPSDALITLAAEERAFAAFTVKEGFRDGFLKYFAEDGIGFGPHPERTREKLMQLPPQTGPRKVIFNWAPMFGDISDAGDLGYTTGPVLYTDAGDNPRPPRHGIYFSVWQKQADGTWKVVVDMGVDTPNAVAPIDTRFVAAKPVGPRVPNRRGKTPGDDFKKLDWNLWRSIAETSPTSAYKTYLDDQFRIHRKGMMPLTPGDSLAPVLDPMTKFEIVDGKIATSGDLAFTYGKYTADYGRGRIENGYYVHVWRRDARSAWRLVADIQNPLPSPAK